MAKSPWSNTFPEGPPPSIPNSWGEWSDSVSERFAERIERDILYGEGATTYTTGNGQTTDITMDSLRETMEEARRITSPGGWIVPDRMELMRQQILTACPELTRARLNDQIESLCNFMGLTEEAALKAFLEVVRADQEVINGMSARQAQLEGFRLRIEHLLNSDHTPFIRGILTSPQEPFPKEIYGDWLEEQGDEDCEGWRWMAKYGKYPSLKRFNRPDTTHTEHYYLWRGPNSAPLAEVQFPWSVLPFALYPKLWSQSLTGNGNSAYHHFSTQDQNCLHAYLDLLQAYRAAPKVRVEKFGDECRCACREGECCKINPDIRIEMRNGMDLSVSSHKNNESGNLLIVAKPRLACSKMGLEDRGFLCLDD